jgi:hypothetical protein
VLIKLTYRYILHFLLFLITAVSLAFVVAKGGLVIGIALLALPFALAYLVLQIKYPVVGLYTYLIISFILNGLGRYLDAPMSVMTDGILLLTLLAEFFHRFYSKKWPSLKNNPVLIFTYVWSAYCVFELVNPQSLGPGPWFFAMRSLFFYMLIIMILGMELMNKEKDLDRFLHIWIFFSCLAVLYGAKQLFLGVNAVEQKWLDDGNALTHVLHGKLRVFSFYSDAGQFGAAMGHVGLVGVILALGDFSKGKKLFYWITGLFCLWGLAISGTRGGLFVPIAGFAIYFLLVKNMKLLIVGGGTALTILFILKFTFIGQGNYQVQRMRSALDPTDASFQVRLNNQKKLKEYLASRPLGGGIGSSGYWGLRFRPDTFLAQTPTDSWYVRVWVETGIVGLTIYLGLFIYILIYFGIKLWKMEPSMMRQKLMAIYAGVTGVTVANYGNPVIGQTPTSTVIFLGIAFLYIFTKEEQKT